MAFYGSKTSLCMSFVLLLLLVNAVVQARNAIVTTPPINFNPKPSINATKGFSPIQNNSLLTTKVPITTKPQVKTNLSDEESIKKYFSWLKDFAMKRNLTAELVKVIKKEGFALKQITSLPMIKAPITSHTKPQVTEGPDLSTSSTTAVTKYETIHSSLIADIVLTTNATKLRNGVSTSAGSAIEPSKTLKPAAKSTKATAKSTKATAKTTINVRAQPSPGSSHFAVVFLFLIALLFGLYALYHNRQKIIAVVVEGRSGTKRGNRERYSKLNSGKVEEPEARIKNSDEVYIY